MARELWKQSTTSAHTAVRRAVTAARDERRITPHDEPFVTLALIVAEQLDSAAGENNAGDVARLTKPLRELLNDLPLRAEEVPRGPGPTGTSEPAGDPVDRELESLLGAGPEMGDTPLS